MAAPRAGRRRGGRVGAGRRVRAAARRDAPVDAEHVGGGGADPHGTRKLCRRPDPVIRLRHARAFAWLVLSAYWPQPRAAGARTQRRPAPREQRSTGSAGTTGGAGTTGIAGTTGTGGTTGWQRRRRWIDRCPDRRVRRSGPHAVRGAGAGNRRRVHGLGPRRRRAALGAVPLPQPYPGIARLSQSNDEATHGRKLYSVFAKNHDAYPNGPHDGQVVVKQSWIPELVTDSDAGFRPIHYTTDAGSTPTTSIPTRRATAASSAPARRRVCSSCSGSIPRRPTPTRAGSTRRSRPPAR